MDMDVKNGYSTSNEKHLGPYRATRLWNELLRVFRDGIPRGRHRRYMKVYDDCFVAADAVSWMRQQMRNNPNFGPSVTRQQTVLLLQKFYKANVFEDVRPSKQVGEDFAENGQLYRFVASTPVKPIRTLARTPLAPRPALINQQHHHPPPPPGLIMKKDPKAGPVKAVSWEGGPSPSTGLLSAGEVEQVWRDTTMKRLCEVLSLESVESILQPELVLTHHIIHNMTQVNKNGIVSNIAKKDQLPPWVLNAMKCLAYWPDKVDDYPNYPGFENDVFRIVKDYFESLDEPLTTHPMYDVLINVMVAAETLNGNDLPQQCATSPSNRPAPPAPPQNLTSFASVENLMLNLTMNATAMSGELPPREILIVHDGTPRARTAGGGGLVRCNSTTSLSRMETSFSADKAEAPKTQVYLTDDNSSQCSNCGSSAVVRTNGYSTGYAKPVLTLDDMRRESNTMSLGRRPRRSLPTNTSSSNGILRNHLSSSSLTTMNSDVNEDKLQYGYTVVLSTTPKTESNSRVIQNDPELPYENPHISSKPPPYVPPPSYTSIYSSSRSLHNGSRGSDSDSSYASARSNFSPDLLGPAYRPPKQAWMAGPAPNNPQQRQQGQRRAGGLAVQKSATNLTESYRMAVGSGTPVGRPLFSNGLVRHDSTPDVRSASIPVTSNERLCTGLGVCLLLLPPANRRKLHLLLRLMHKMMNNKHIQLDGTHNNSKKKLLLSTFSRCVLRPSVESDYDELLSMHTVSFMIQHYQQLMAVPQTLKQNIEARILTLRQQKVSVTQYEQQKLSGSQLALAELLQGIVTETSMTAKDKKRRLKQFQKNHPDIYKQRFPTSASEQAIFPDHKPKIKQPLLAKPLLRLKNLRL